MTGWLRPFSRSWYALGERLSQTNSCARHVLAHTFMTNQDLLIINSHTIEAITPLGNLILTAVWRKCQRSPMDDGQLSIHPDEQEIAIKAFKSLGIELTFPLLRK